MKNKHEKQQKNLIFYRSPGGQLSPDYPIANSSMADSVILKKELALALYSSKSEFMISCRLSGSVSRFGVTLCFKEFQYLGFTFSNVFQ